MIGPDCIFNRVENRYEIFIENEETGETWSSLFDEKPISQTRQMAELVYGSEFLKQEGGSTQNQTQDISNDVFQEIMACAKNCNTQKMPWHNHHLLPNCQLNSRKGSHCIVFEDEKQENQLFAYFEEDPLEALSRLEALYFNTAPKPL
jgi:hypothetical protein